MFSLEGIGDLLHGVSYIDRIIARDLLNETKDVYAERIRISTDLKAIANLLFSIDWIQGGYLFCWDEIPGKDSGELIENLQKIFSIDWVKKAGIEKIDYGKAIIVSTKTNSISLRLNNENTKVNLVLDEGRTDEFIAVASDGKLCIYDEGIAHALINETKDVYTEKIRASADLEAIAYLLDGLRGLNFIISRAILNETKDVIAEKIRDSINLWKIKTLLKSISWIDNEIAVKLKKGIDEKTAKRNLFNDLISNINIRLTEVITKWSFGKTER